VPDDLREASAPADGQDAFFDDKISTGPRPMAQQEEIRPPRDELFGSIPRVLTGDGRPARIASWRHTTGDYFRAARVARLEALSCDEPQLSLGDTAPLHAFADGPLNAGDWRDWPWNLNDLVPQASWAAHQRRPATVIWQFRKPAG
jgi:hypothetical protein